MQLSLFSLPRYTYQLETRPLRYYSFSYHDPPPLLLLPRNRKLVTQYFGSNIVADSEKPKCSLLVWIGADVSSSLLFEERGVPTEPEQRLTVTPEREARGGSLHGTGWSKSKTRITARTMLRVHIINILLTNTAI